jgi:hypothetical protein
VWLKELFLNFFFCPSTVEIFSICFRLRVWGRWQTEREANVQIKNSFTEKLKYFWCSSTISGTKKYASCEWSFTMESLLPIKYLNYQNPPF